MSVQWPDEIMQVLEEAMKGMPASIRRMAMNRLTEDIEVRLSLSGRVDVQVDDVLLVARRMVSGRMYENLVDFFNSAGLISEDPPTESPSDSQ